MKLRQREFCHNCQQYVIYEFDDITEKQIIICPNCGHQHYRELDEGTIVNIRLEGNESEFRMMQQPDLSEMAFTSDTGISPIPIITKTFKIIRKTEDGRPIIEKNEDIEGISHEQTRIITERRWGRDPRQK